MDDTENERLGMIPRQSMVTGERPIVPIMKLADRTPPARAEEMNVVRRFVAADIPQVAELHRRVFSTADSSDAGWMDLYRRYFADVFLEQAPWSADGTASLVYEEAPGSVVGFLGVHQRPMLYEARPIRMALASQFVVDPARRGLIGLRMLKQFLDGPQDLSLADEAVDGTRHLWEWCGGATALLYSIHWVRPLQPARTALALFKRRSPRLARVAAPAAWMVDALSGGHPLPINPPEGSSEELDEAIMAARLPEFAGECSLRPDYGEGLPQWLLQRAGTRKTGGPFRKMMVKDEKQQIAGWYIYFANRGGFGEVLQICARKQTAGQVLDHLLDDARRCGVVALSGRLDPAFAHELSERDCLLYRRGFWTVIHSRRPELLRAIERGDAFLTRLEGEWCLRFR